MATKHKRTTMTARQLAEDYLAHQITRDVTRTSTRHHLNQLLALFGGWQARRVGAAQMQAFLAAQKERGVMATTAHHRVRLWRTVLAWAVETGRLPASPLAGFRLHRPRARRIDPPTRAEATRMYKMAAPHIRRVIVLGMAAGPRIGPSELFRLTWGDVELEAGYMRMPNAADSAREKSRSRGGIFLATANYTICKRITKAGRSPLFFMPGGRRFPDMSPDPARLFFSGVGRRGQQHATTTGFYSSMWPTPGRPGLPSVPGTVRAEGSPGGAGCAG